MFAWLFSDPLPVGTKAPEFSLPDQDGRMVSLAALRGQNVVLVFYPGDDTPTCRQQLCEFRDRWEQAKMRGVTVFGINPRGAASHKKFVEKFRFPFPLLVDKNQAVGKLYNASGPIVKRTVYLIDREGVVRYGKRGKPVPEEVLSVAR